MVVLFLSFLWFSRILIQAKEVLRRRGGMWMNQNYLKEGVPEGTTL